MKRLGSILMALFLTFIMSFSVFAKGISIDVKADANGKVKVTGKSDKTKEDVSIKVESGKKIYYLDQDKTDEKGDFEFEFKVDKDKDYSGKINFVGKSRNFDFSTKKDIPNPDKDKEVEVYIRVEGYDHTIIPRRKIKVGLFDLTEYLGKASGSSSTQSKGWGVDKFKKPSNAHAMVQALKEAGFKPGKKDEKGYYDFQNYGWSLYIAMIDGDREHDYEGMSGWMYRVNGKMPNIGCDKLPLKEGDDIVWYYGAYGFDNVYTILEADKREVKAGEKVKIHLKGYEGGFNAKETNVKDAFILVNGEEYKINGEKVKTDSDGNAVLKFDKSGKYEFSAERFSKENKRDIVRPVPVTIEVKGGGSSSGGSSSNRGSSTKPSDDKKNTSNKNTDKNVDKKIVEKADKIKKAVKVSKEDLKIEVKANKNVVALKNNVLNNKINKLNEIIKEELKDIKDEKEKELLKKELSVVPIEIEEEKEDVVLEFGESEIKNMKNKEVGVKVDFAGAEIKVPYAVIKEIKDGEKVEIRKSEVQDKTLENKIKGKEKVLAKLYKFDVVKLQGNNEKEVKLEDSTKIIIKVEDNKLNGVEKDSLKIAWYDEKTESWKTLKSQFIPEKNIVIGEI